MTPERHKLAVAKFGFYTSRIGLHTGSPLSTARYEGAKDAYMRGFSDGVEEVLTSSPKLEALETSLKLKDIRLAILEKENKHLNLRIEHRKKLHEEVTLDLKSAIDRLTLIIALRDPALLSQMNSIREKLEVNDRA